MLKPEQIPIEVRAVLQKACDGEEPWNIADTLAAAINAWPNSYRDNYKAERVIILPLTQEETNGN